MGRFSIQLDYRNGRWLGQAGWPGRCQTALPGALLSGRVSIFNCDGTLTGGPYRHPLSHNHGSSVEPERNQATALSGSLAAFASLAARDW